MNILKWPFSKRAREKSESETPALAQILLKLTALKKQAYVPIVEEGDCGASGSKFSGHPQISNSNPWPICPSCSNAMQLFWQQNLADSDLVHSYPQSYGLLQFFYCVSQSPLCENECESYAPFSKATHLRVVDIGEGEGEGEEQVAALPKVHFPAKKIIGWEIFDDYPDCEELEEIGISLTDAEQEVYMDSYPITGEKIGGWPLWVQSVEYPDCPKCSARMEYLIQVDSEQNLPHMFGDAGVGHLSFCKSHPEVMSFHWACH